MAPTILGFSLQRIQDSRRPVDAGIHVSVLQRRSRLDRPADTWKVVRQLMGATNPADAAPGTIRGDLALSMPDNLVHGSDSPESAERELGLFFAP